MSGAYIFLIIITVACMRMKCMPLLTKRKNCNLFCFLVNTPVHLKYLHVLFDYFFPPFFINERERKKCWKFETDKNFLEKDNMKNSSFNRNFMPDENLLL